MVPASASEWTACCSISKNAPQYSIGERSSAGALALDKFEQGAEGLKDRRVDLVIFDRDSQPFFEGREQGHDAHRIEIGHRAHPWRRVVETHAATAKMQGGIDQFQQF